MSVTPSSQQRRWIESIVDWCHSFGGIQVLYGDEWANCPFHIHHIKGRSFKHNKVHIGHEMIIPVPVVLHDVSSNHPCNVTHFKHNFTRQFGMQTELFEKMVECMRFLKYEVPSDEILLTIMDVRA